MKRSNSAGGSRSSPSPACSAWECSVSTPTFSPRSGCARISASCSSSVRRVHRVLQRTGDLRVGQPRPERPLGHPRRVLVQRAEARHERLLLGQLQPHQLERVDVHQPLVGELQRRDHRQREERERHERRVDLHAHARAACPAAPSSPSATSSTGASDSSPAIGSASSPTRPRRRARRRTRRRAPARARRTAPCRRRRRRRRRGCARRARRSRRRRRACSPKPRTNPSPTRPVA